MPNSGAFRSLHCLIYKVLAPSAQRRNIYYLTTLFRTCQVLFSISFEIFFHTRFVSFFSCLVRSFCIIPDSLSLVKYFFRFLSKSFPLSAVVLPYRQTAQLVYQTLPDLSSLFFDSIKSFFSTRSFAVPCRTPVPSDSLCSIANAP